MKKTTRKKKKIWGGEALRLARLIPLRHLAPLSSVAFLKPLKMLTEVVQEVRFCGKEKRALEKTWINNKKKTVEVTAVRKKGLLFVIVGRRFLSPSTQKKVIFLRYLASVQTKQNNNTS